MTPSFVVLMLNMMVVLHVSEAKANLSGTISKFRKLYPQYLFLSNSDRASVSRYYNLAAPPLYATKQNSIAPLYTTKQKSIATASWIKHKYRLL